MYDSMNTLIDEKDESDKRDAKDESHKIIHSQNHATPAPIIRWVGEKKINLDNINLKILKCIETKHFTNNGENVIHLQKKIKRVFGLDDRHDVLMTCNGAMALNALIGGYNMYYGKKLRWVVQAFTFPSSRQGLLSDSMVLDTDHNMGIDVNLLEKNKDTYDGMVITNCFGCTVNIKLYMNFCALNNKLLVFDNAASPLTYIDTSNHLNAGDGSFVSLHHTKPIGFGEGGFITYDTKYHDCMKRSICFGYTEIDKYHYSVWANNYKMSEIAAIYVDEYLNNLQHIYDHHTTLIQYFINGLNDSGMWAGDRKITLYKNFSSYNESLMSCIPVIFWHSVDVGYFTDRRIEVKKYYHPLDETCTHSVSQFNHLICFPLNFDTTHRTIDYYLEIIAQYEKEPYSEKCNCVTASLSQ